jgi:hypothetical protein
MMLDEINKELRKLADKAVETYVDIEYDDLVLAAFENSRIQAETERFYDQDAVFYGKNS